MITPFGLYTGKPPVDAAETVEIIEFMAAAQLSGERSDAELLLEKVRRQSGQCRIGTIQYDLA